MRRFADSMSRRELLRRGAAAGLASALPLHGTQITKEAGGMNTSRKPNIIFILTDDQGYGDVGLFGNRDLETPHIDRLGTEGIQLTQHYTGSPLCAPARAALLTGRYNHRTGALSVESNRALDRFGLRERTMGDVFGAAGYATGMIGKWHNGLFDMRYHPNNRGFVEFAGFLNGGMRYYDWVLDYNGRPRYSDGRYLTDVFTDEAVEFIQRHKTQPFFLYLAYNAPHSPLEAPEADVKHFMDKGKFNPHVATLYAMIRAMDRGIGRIMETLRNEGLDENTLIVFTSDNGPWLGGYKGHSMERYNGPFRGMKQDTLEGGIRVPAMVRWPGGFDPRVHHGMVHFTDWLPTLASATGIRTEGTLPLDGTDMLESLRGKTGGVNPKRFWQFNRYEPVPHCNAAMRDGKWKLYYPWIPEAKLKLTTDNIWYYGMFEQPHFETPVSNPPFERTLSPAPEPELYDIDADPHESTDLAKKFPERVSKMVHDMDNWFDEVNAERRKLDLL